MTDSAHAAEPPEPAGADADARVRAATGSEPARTFDHDRIREGVQAIFEGLGLDADDPVVQDTPERFARMCDEVFAGLLVDPRRTLDVVFEEGHDELIMERDIPVASICVPSKQHVNAVGGTKRARDVCVGDLLWTFDEDGHLAQTEVVSVGARKTRDMVRVRAGSGSFKLTPEHPVRTRDGWKPAGELEAGDEVRWMHSRRLCMDRLPVQEGYALGYVLGAVGSEASIQDGRRVSFVVSDLAFAERFRKSLHEAFELEPEIQEVDVPSGFLQRDVTMYRVRVVSRHLAHMLLWWFGAEGETKDTKEFHFPRVVLRSTEMMEGFLDGYCDGDGCWGQNGPRTIVSADRTFLAELGEVLSTHGFQVEDTPLLPGDATWAPVEAVERVDVEGGKPYTVYSFQCHPHPTFLVGGVLTHNCEHHLLPLVGRAHVGYLPNKQGQITGVSKLARLVDLVCKRPNLQERITTTVADVLEEALEPRGVICIIEAEHMCMSMRGVKKPGAVTVTSAVRGAMRDSHRTREEAMTLALGHRRIGN